MSSKVELKPLKTKYFPKAFMQSEKIKFGQQVDKETGEIVYKEFQATAYVLKGMDSDYEPMACLSLKLGNGSLSLFADDYDQLERAVDALGAFIAKIKATGNRKVVDEKNAYRTKKKAIKRVKSDLALK